MYVQQPTYGALSALVLGYDLASAGGVLCGFREWLIPRLGSGSNLAWPALVLRITFPEESNPEEALRSDAEKDKRAIDGMFRLIDEFLATRARPEGMRRVFFDYEQWLRTQAWYGPESPQWLG
jgi:hypothetical protein